MNKLFRKFKYILYLLFRPIWELEKLVPRSKKIWIFGAWFGEKYSDNSKYVYEHAINFYPEIKAIWLTKSDEVLNKLKQQNKPVYKINSLAGAYYSLRAKWCFLSSGVDDVNKYFINGAKQIWLWHGMPLKKIERSVELENNIYTKKYKLFKVLFPYSNKNPYLSISSSAFFDPIIMEAFGLTEEKVLKVGLPRCDALFTIKDEPVIKKLRQKFNNATILLYMPTFRKIGIGNGKAFSPFVSDFGFDKDSFVRFLNEENIILLYKSHFVDSDLEIENFCERFIILSDNDFEDLYVLLNSVDGLITDYSSVYFDYLPKEKPIYLLAFDYENYIKQSRSHYYNMFQEMNGVYCNNWDDFYLKVKSNEFERINMEESRKKFASYLKGKSSDDVIKYLLSIK